jgi:hypothetical protein
MNDKLNKFMNLTPNSLRVGNYVNYENTTHVIDEIHQEKVIHHWIKSGHDGYVTKYSQILMIPISIKEIEHLGFILDGDLYFDNNGYCIDVSNDIFWLCQHIQYLKKDDEIIKIARIDYLHELQNLYYDLTKRELKY